MNGLRQVIYKKNYDSQDRKGYFHCWAGKAIEGIGGNFIQVTYGIVEDANTGELVNIFPVDERGGKITFKAWDSFE